MRVLKYILIITITLMTFSLLSVFNLISEFWYLSTHPSLLIMLATPRCKEPPLEVIYQFYWFSISITLVSNFILISFSFNLSYLLFVFILHHLNDHSFIFFQPFLFHNILKVMNFDLAAYKCWYVILTIFQVILVTISSSTGFEERIFKYQVIWNV